MSEASCDAEVCTADMSQPKEREDCHIDGFSLRGYSILPTSNNTRSILVGGLEHFLFSHILGIIIPIDVHISQRGGLTTNQHQITCKLPMLGDRIRQGWTALCHHPHELEPQIHPPFFGWLVLVVYLMYLHVCVIFFMCLHDFTCVCMYSYLIISDHDS